MNMSKIITFPITKRIIKTTPKEATQLTKPVKQEWEVRVTES